MTRFRDIYFLRSWLLSMSLLIIAVSTPAGSLSVQQPVKHLNPVVEKLAAGKPFIA